MALVALTISATESYVSDRDPCKVKTQVPLDFEDLTKGTVEQVTILEGASKFAIKPLDVFLKGHIYDNASSLIGRQGSDEVGIKTRVNQTNIDAARFGLAGIENFANKAGAPVVFKTRDDQVNGRDYKSVTDEVLNALGLELIQELAGEIKRISEVSAEEAKNSVLA